MSSKALNNLREKSKDLNPVIIGWMYLPFFPPFALITVVVRDSKIGLLQLLALCTRKERKEGPLNFLSLLKIFIEI